MTRDEARTRDELILNRLKISKISHVNTVTHDRDYRCPSFFMGNPKFHHDGIEGRQPHEVVLCRPNLHDIEHYVFVYTTGNGSGRTTELAASASLRGGILSIVTTADKDIPPEIVGWEREQACIEKLKALLDEAIKENPTALRIIIRTMNECREPKASGDHQARLERVRIVFCIDDAHDCPNLITGIVREPLDIGDKMGWYIASGCDGKLGGNCKTERKINVVFSVVGTGQYGRSVGSLPSYYDCFTPSWQKLDKTSSDTLSD
mmetsp:Transcript_23244/g.64829  ORF Transcript_23244/g.64829 Transcript_23244/m.64829 type:complete len:263 (-) Transcript_23244:440-1228(-)